MSRPQRKSSSVKVRQNRADKTDAIVAKAREMVADKGPAEFSINQLAKSLGYTPGALYWYFPSKEAVVGAVQRDVFGEFGQVLSSQREQWSAQAEAVSDDEQQRALYVLARLARYYLAEVPAEYTRMIAFSLDPRVWLDDEQGALLGPVLVQVFQQVAIPFAGATQCEALRAGAAPERAVQYWAALQGMVQTGKLARLAPGLFDTRRLGMSTAHSMLIGWGADPARVDRAFEWVESEAPSRESE